MKRRRDEEGADEAYGIVDADIYFPSLYVQQDEMEDHDGVSKGKYTLGLGQSQMAVCSDREDACSMALNVVSRLLDKHGIDVQSVGRVEVGTESIVDKSKSIKTVLMRLFKSGGNFEVEGLDTYNACYGGTQALFNAIDWMYSPFRRKEYAIVVTTDVAVYAHGPARPTGGGGAVALLIGRDPILAMKPGMRVVYMDDTLDFFKPNGRSEYPYVDGPLSISCYLRAFDYCYARLAELYYSRSIDDERSQSSSTSHMNGKGARQNGVSGSNGGVSPSEVNVEEENNSKGEIRRLENGTSLASTDRFSSEWEYATLHAPYCKLVRKAIGRVVWHERESVSAGKSREGELMPYSHLSPEQSLQDKGVEKVLAKMGEPLFDQKVACTLTAASRVGNMYTGSLYGCIISLLCTTSIDEAVGKNVLAYSYGSGLASAMFLLSVRRSAANTRRLIDLDRRLDEREKITPAQAEYVLDVRERMVKDDLMPSSDLKSIRKGDYYLAGYEKGGFRMYKQKQ
eukprot:CAMPEP_0113891328 /NCGR_PEP_ID=MMETSP0780_2-20120614/14693_1 /TAXON_ID=652834 /ORGANISM="Palpitomonas bilix" /LENGTH=510 /DNA_ID=CAMNT_0000880929 /DNA_START=26 /DNA_END=1558 /DNA_ORIENTATION=+ /assembly_acc=CAM_ASM_000599